MYDIDVEDRIKELARPLCEYLKEDVGDDRVKVTITYDNIHIEYNQHTDISM